MVSEDGDVVVDSNVDVLLVDCLVEDPGAST